DLGTIELAAPSALVGRLDLPSDCLELGFHCDVVVPLAGNTRTYRFEIGRDGRFEARPLPAGGVQLHVALGEFPLSSVESAGERYIRGRGLHFDLAPARSSTSASSSRSTCCCADASRMRVAIRCRVPR